MSKGVSKDEHKEEAVTIAHVPDTVKCPVTNFVAGNIAHHISDWRLITSDQESSRFYLAIASIL